MFWKKRRNCKHTSYKFEADFVADSIWCNDCGENLDIEEFPLTDELREQLMDWVSEYGKWIDLETDLLEENGLQLVGNHNEKIATTPRGEETVRRTISNRICSIRILKIIE
ncbi:hypothetical protein [Bacillus sp. ISL-40]|uniref:hypothetical protein n=1 Tax=Bacillus sp. ISL-40 TaxID=2819126 RepID=UPI002034C6B2|nr:hypothetical protein [Bacillus sp. ISL-40]